MERELGECPAERGEQVRHGRDVQQDDVTGDALRAFRLLGVAPTTRDLGEEAAGITAGVGEQLTDRDLDAGERGAFGALVGRRAVGHAIGMNERVGAVESIEIGDEPVEPRRLGRGVADPARETETMPDAACEPEGVERPCCAELGELEVERVIEVPEVGLHVLRAEQIVRERADSGEQLLGQLAHEHAVVGESLARVALGHRVERAQAGR